MISSILKSCNICVELESTDKEESFAELLENLILVNPKLNRKSSLSALIIREEKMSTAIYPKIAVPHAVCKEIKNPLISVGISHSGIEFEPINNEKQNPVVNIIFLVLYGENDTQNRLNVLKSIIQLVTVPDFIERVLKAKSSEEVYDLIVSLE